MSYSSIIENRIDQFNPNEIIVARKLIMEELSGIPETAFFKTLERMVRQNILVRISKGIYCKPKTTRFGIIQVNENAIIQYFTGNKKNGMIIGYRLYNNEGLTTQIPKNTELYSNLITEDNKMVKNISIYKLDMKLEESKVKMIENLEILQNCKKIEDLNNRAFASYLKKAAYSYDNEAAMEILGRMKYKKSTVAFLESILNHYCVKNTLSRFLSRTSKYEFPEIEGIYEFAH